MKKISLVVILMLCISILSGCAQASNKDSAGAGEEGKTVISFINGFTGADGPFMTKIVDGFNNSQDKYVVEQLQTADHYVKFKSDDFDMLIIHSDWISTYHQDGFLKEVSDVYDMAGLSFEDDFHPKTQTYAKYDDGVFAFPLDLYAYTMYYNKEYVSDDEVPTTYEDLVALSKKLDSENSGVYTLGLPLTGDHQWAYMTFLTQMGVDFVKDGHIKLDTEEAADAFMKINQLIYKDKISPANLGANDQFNPFVKKSEGNTNIQTAISLTGPWNYTPAKEVWGDNLGIATIPVMGDELRVPAGGHNFAVSAKVEDEEKLKGIAEFMKYAYNPEVMINWADSGQAPIHLGTMEEVKNNPEKYPVAQVNYGIFDKAEILPAIYNVREQVKYVNETVWAMVITTPDLKKEALMEELKTATEIAKELSEQ